MSAAVNGNKISLTRGDTLKLLIDIFRDDGERYELSPGDSVRFAMKKRISDADPIILKTIPTDTMVLTINPEDTKNLKFGTYTYDIELTTENGDVDTFIGPAPFSITEEVH